MNEIIVDFSVFSNEISYTEINNILWLKCDSFSEKWWRINNSEKWAINDQNIWIIQSWVNKNVEDLELHIDALYKILIPIKEKLVKLWKKWCEFTLSIIRYSNDVNPCGYIESKYIKFLWELWADLDLDIYCLWDK
jgi:hypothetical protein